MNKKALVRYIVRATNLNIRQAENALAAFWQAVSDTLQKGKIVFLSGKGKFALRTTMARTITQVNTGKTINIPARSRLSFKASKKFKADITKQSTAEKTI